MSARKGIVLDANILIRAVLGTRVRALLEAYEDEVEFFAPDVCFEDAREYIPVVLSARGVAPALGLVVLDSLAMFIRRVDLPLYCEHEQVARERMAARDVEDWPVLAVAMLLDLPIWTEDRDFFGSGVATWTTDRVGVYLRGA
jgi:predicted nucleic acid-binding protein